MLTQNKGFEDAYYQHTTKSYRDCVHLIIEKPELIEPDLVFLVERKVVTSGGPFGAGGPYGYSCIVYKDVKDKVAVVYVAETVSAESLGVNHPANVLGHLVDMKVQKETSLMLDGCSEYHVRGILVCRTLEDNWLQKRMKTDGLEYIEISQSVSFRQACMT